MSTITKDQVLEAISNMSVMEIVELVRSMEDKFGVSAAAVAVAAPVAGGSGAANVEEKTEFDVVMKGFGDSSKIGVIKVVRVITGLGLKEAKDMVESVSTKGSVVVKAGISKSDAEGLKKQLEEVGAVVDVK